MTCYLQASDAEITLLMEIGFLCRYARRFDDAREIFGGVQALRPESEVPLVALGTVAFDEANFAKAIEIYYDALQLQPNSAYAYAHLGEAQIFLRDKQSARASLEKAISLDPRGEAAKLARSLLVLADATI